MKKDKNYPEKCLNRVGNKRCGINFYPTSQHALKEYSLDVQKDAKENRFGFCESGSHCRPVYSKKFRNYLEIRSKWIGRLLKEMS